MKDYKEIMMVELEKITKELEIEKSFLKALHKDIIGQCTQPPYRLTYRCGMEIAFDQATRTLEKMVKNIKGCENMVNEMEDEE